MHWAANPCTTVVTSSMRTTFLRRREYHKISDYVVTATKSVIVCRPRRCVCIEDDRALCNFIAPVSISRTIHARAQSCVGCCMPTRRSINSLLVV